MTAPNVAPGTGIAGKFSVRSLLGHGGATATFRVVTAQGRDVALKLYSPVIGQRPDVMQQLQRFVAETNALPQDLVAHVLEAGYDPATAAPFTATDMVQAPSLAQLVMRRPMSNEEIGAVLRTLAATLDASHARELFHHGLKPTNLFIDPSMPGNVKLTDYGLSLARLLMPTSEGYLLAAPWVAPEQLQPGVPAGAAADVFSAALVCFFALTGRSYWRSCQGAVDVPAWQRELMSPRAAVSVRAGELGIPLSTSFDAVFARALAHDPRERFRSAGEFASMFSGFATRSLESGATLALSSSPLDPTPPPPAEPAGLGPGALSQQQFVNEPTAPAPDGPPGSAAPASSGTRNGSAASAEVLSSATMIAAATTPRSSWGRAAPVVVSAAAVLLLGGAVLAWFVMGRTDKPDVAPSASAEPSATAQVAEQQPALPASSSAQAAPEPAPAESTANNVEEAPPDAGVEAEPSGNVLVQLTCKPAPCDEVMIDGTSLKDLDAELRLKPGAHRVSVKRTGYFPKTETFTVKAGTPIERELALTAMPTGTQAGAAKPCGKFLKRCK